MINKQKIKEKLYVLALLYTYIYSNRTFYTISSLDLNLFSINVINNLFNKNIDLSIFNDGPIYEEEPIFYSFNDEQNNTYYTLMPNFDFKRATTYYLGCLDDSVIIASQKNNALNKIGLIKIDDQIMTLDNYKKDRIKCLRKS